MLKSNRMSIAKSFASLFAGVVILALGLGTASADVIEWNDAMNSAARAVKESRFADAERWLRTAIKEAEKFGPEDRRLAESLSSLASVLYAQGNYAEAGALFKRVLLIVEKTQGPQHLRVADALTGLAGIYHVQGQYAEAEPLLERALAIREKVLGPEHPDVAGSLNNL